MRRFWMFAVASLIGSQPMRLVANIPAFRLEVFVGDSLARTISIAPGMPNFRTPRGPYAITSVEWNPWWSPPKSAWAAREKPTRPGGTNPMGRVKLNVRPLYLSHGTPAERSTGSAASHGCIRLKNSDALALADLVQRFGSSTLSPQEVDRLLADTVTTQLIPLDQPVPVEIRYDLVEVCSGKITAYRDVYGLASRPMFDEIYAMLTATGIDTMIVDSSRVLASIGGIPERGGRCRSTHSPSRELPAPKG